MIRTQCNVPPGLMGQGPVTTRPPPLSDPYVDAADQNLEEALDDLDEAAASGDQAAVANAQTNVNRARDVLAINLKRAGSTVGDYESAKAEEAAAAAAAAQPPAQSQAQPKAEATPGVHPAWYVGIFGAALLAGYAGYKAGGG
jgi:hypothetical protein